MAQNPHPVGDALDGVGQRLHKRCQLPNYRGQQQPQQPARRRADGQQCRQCRRGAGELVFVEAGDGYHREAQHGRAQRQPAHLQQQPAKRKA